MTDGGKIIKKYLSDN